MSTLEQVLELIMEPMLEPIRIVNPSNFLLCKGHRGNITVYLDRIHQFLCPVNFL